jgi:hypothetical protein
MKSDPWSHGNATYSRTNNTNTADAPCTVQSASTDYGVHVCCGQDNELPTKLATSNTGIIRCFTITLSFEYEGCIVADCL